MRFKSEKQRSAVMAMLRKKGLTGKPIAYERKGNFNHIVMKPASIFKSGSFRTIDIGRKGNVKAIIGKPKGSKKTTVKTFLIPIKGGKTHIVKEEFLIRTYGGKMGLGDVFSQPGHRKDKTQISEEKKEEFKRQQEENKKAEEKLKAEVAEWKTIDNLAYNKRTAEIDRLDALSTRELMKRGLEDKDLKDSYGVEDDLDKGGTRITVSDIKGGKSVEEKVASHKEKAEQHANEQKKWIIRDSPDEWTDIGNNLLYNKRTGAIKKVDFNPDGGKVEDVIFKRVGNAETGEINLEKTMQPVGRFDKNTNTVEINVAEIARRSKDEDDFVKNLTNVDAHEHIHSAIHDESPSNPKSYEEFRNRRIKEDKAISDMVLGGKENGGRIVDVEDDDDPFNPPNNRKRQRKWDWYKGAKVPEVQIKEDVRFVGIHKGNKIMIDKDVPKKYRPSIVKHEFIEAQIMKEKIPYHTAHKISQRIERDTFPHGKNEWKRYSRIVNKIHQDNIAKGVISYKS